jgi:hypothetical protein
MGLHLEFIAIVSGSSRCIQSQPAQSLSLHGCASFYARGAAGSEKTALCARSFWALVPKTHTSYIAIASRVLVPNTIRWEHAGPVPSSLARLPRQQSTTQTRAVIPAIGQFVPCTIRWKHAKPVPSAQASPHPQQRQQPWASTECPNCRIIPNIVKTLSPLHRSEGGPKRLNPCRGHLAVGNCWWLSTPRNGATWSILPVVILLSQRLSHACLSVNIFL